MLVRFALALFLSALVPILGLTSCSKDPATDDWSMTEPVVEGPALAASFTQVNHRSLPLEASIRFKNAWSSLQVEASCALDDQSFKETFDLAYREVLTVKELWPRELTAKASAKELERSACDFKFTAANASGSTHEFRLQDIKLDRFVSTKEVLSQRSLTNVNEKNSRPLSLRNGADILTTVIDDLTAGFKNDVEFSLICGSQRSSSILRAKTDETLEDLRKGLSLKGDQSCHFLARELNSDSNRFALSADSQMRFSSPPVDITVVTTMPLNEPTAAIQKMRVVNHNSETVFLKIPQQVPNFRFRFARLDNSKLVLSPVELSFNGGVQVTGGFSIAPNVVAITPNSELTIFLTPGPMLSSQMTQAKGCLVIPTLDFEQIPFGFSFGFDAEYSISQLESAGDQDGLEIYRAPLVTQSGGLPGSMIDSAHIGRFGASIPEWVGFAPTELTPCF